MEPRTLWVIFGILVIVAMLFAGLLPLPGERDDSTPLVQPSPPGQSPGPTAPRAPEGRLPVEPPPPRQ